MELQLSHRVVGLLGPELHGLAWLLTYSIHAVVWAAAVSLMTRWRPLSPAWRHTAWKSALLAPLCTTLLVFTTTWPIAAERAASSSPPHVTVLVPGDPPAQGATPLAATSPSLSVDETSARRLGRVLDLIGAAALAAAAFGLLRFGVSAARLGRRLGPRRRLEDGRLFELLQRLRPRFALGPVALSDSAEVDSPLVLGGAEICLPQTGLSELSDAELQAVFAHELAHVERGDGWWFPVIGLFESALWFHPVTRWVCGHVRQSAELACDARCVQLTGEPRALALALMRLASRAVAPKRALALPTMTQPRNGLVARVAELTSASGPSALAPLHGRNRLLLGLALAAVASAALNVRVTDAGATEARAGERLDVTKLSQAMNALAARQLLLEAELERLSSASGDRASETAASVRALEIEQELRHTRDMQQWFEQRLLDE